jgi:hypothetical protein
MFFQIRQNGTQAKQASCFGRAHAAVASGKETRQLHEQRGQLKPKTGLFPTLFQYDLLHQAVGEGEVFLSESQPTFEFTAPAQTGFQLEQCMISGQVRQVGDGPLQEMTVEENINQAEFIQVLVFMGYVFRDDKDIARCQGVRQAMYAVYSSAGQDQDQLAEIMPVRWDIPLFRYRLNDDGNVLRGEKIGASVFPLHVARLP